MAGAHQFEYGWISPILAYLLSLLGCLLGLVATVRARSAATLGLRARWLVLAAFAIGGTGIWAMHFLAMIGFSVDGTPVHFDVPITVASWLIAVITVGIGMFIVGFGRPSLVKVLSAGLLTGLGVAAMHYSGMAAMRVNGTVSYDRRYVITSVVIAIVAATVALWFTVAVQRPLAVVGSAILMAGAVSGMHYSGMFGLRIHVHDQLADVPGTAALAFLVPILVLVLLVMLALFYALLAVPSQADRAVQAELRARIDGSHPATRPTGYGPAFGGPLDSSSGSGPVRPATGSRRSAPPTGSTAPGYPDAGHPVPEWEPGHRSVLPERVPDPGRDWTGPTWGTPPPSPPPGGTSPSGTPTRR